MESLSSDEQEEAEKVVSLEKGSLCKRRKVKSESSTSSSDDGSSSDYIPKEISSRKSKMKIPEVKIKMRTSRMDKDEFSPVIEQNGIWRTGPVIKIMKNELVEHIVRLCRNTSQFSDFELPSFEKEGSKFAKFNKDVFDKLQWTRKTKGEAVVKPRIRDTKIGLIDYQIKNMNSPLSSSFKKFTIREMDSSEIIIVYVSTEPRWSYEDLLDNRKSKMTNNESETIRNALKNSTVSDAAKHLRNVLPHISTNQIRNVSRSVSECKKGKRGPTPVTTSVSLAALQPNLKNFSFFNSHANGYEFVHIDRDMLNIYIKSLPLREKVNEYQESLIGCEKWELTDINHFIESHRMNTSFGVVRTMTGQMQLDSTFDLSDCVVTVLSADVSSFRTKSSGKVRHAILGFMLSSSKKDVHHKFFGSKLNELLLDCDPLMNKAIPSAVTDGEIALCDYFKGPYFKSTVILRCAVHRRSNLIHKLGNSNVTDDDLQWLFGRTDERGYVLGGCLDVLTLEQLREKIDSFSGNEMMKNWVLEREEDLFKSNSLYVKLKAGILMQYMSTNRIECVNSKIKTAITKKLEGKQCASKLKTMIEDEKSEMAVSIIDGTSRLILHENYRNISNSSGFDRSKALQKVGFRSSSISHVLQIPQTVWKYVGEVKVNETFQLRVTILLGNDQTSIWSYDMRPIPFES